jgi:hypothetical protein
VPEPGGQGGPATGGAQTLLLRRGLRRPSCPGCR